MALTLNLGALGSQPEFIWAKDPDTGLMQGFLVGRVPVGWVEVPGYLPPNRVAEIELLKSCHWWEELHVGPGCKPCPVGQNCAAVCEPDFGCRPRVAYLIAGAAALALVLWRYLK